MSFPLPGAIIFINKNVVDQVRDTLRKQLYITTLLDGYQFDDIIALNPEYPTFVRNNNERVMVMRPLSELENRTLADVVVHVVNGLAVIEKNKFGPPGLTYRVGELYWGKLNVYAVPI